MRDTVRTLTQEKIQHWFDQAIRPHTTDDGVFKKMMGEMRELADEWECSTGPNERVREEAADVLICFIAWAHMVGIPLDSDVRAKLAINKKRKWGPPDADGVIQHV